MGLYMAPFIFFIPNLRVIDRFGIKFPNLQATDRFVKIIFTNLREAPMFQERVDKTMYKEQAKAPQ